MKGGAFLAVVVAASVGCAARGRPPSPSVAAVEGYAAGADGVRLFYRKVGSGGSFVVYLHGGPGLNFEAGGPDLEPLAAGRTLVMYDQRGGGRSDLVSDPALLTAPHHVRDLEALRRGFGVRSMVLVGMSWGAGLATLYASEYPQHVERLVLLSPMPPARDPFTEARGNAFIAALGPERFARLRALFDAHHTAPDGDLPSICRELDGLTRAVYVPSPAARARLRGDVCRFPPAALRSQGKNGLVIQASLGDWDFRPLAARILVPTLVVEGADSTVPLDAARAWVAALPDARMLLVPGAGHEPYAENQEEFFGPVLGFLDGRWPQ